MDYFTLFDLPISVPVDKSLLKQRYQQLQQQYHPDQFVTAPADKQREALSFSALINDGWQTLSHPIDSLLYLLSLQGFSQSEGITLNEKPFLMQQFMLREELDQIMGLSDLDKRENKLQQFSARIQQENDKIMQQAITYIAQQKWKEGLATAIKLQFFDKLQQQINRELESVEELLFLR